MSGQDEFAELFGGITVSELIKYVMAAAFLYFVYRKVSTYLISRHDAEKEKDALISKALAVSERLPEIEKEIVQIMDAIQEHKKSIEHLDDTIRQRDLGSKYDRLVQGYRYYSGSKNPKRAWTRMEHDAFMAVFKEYEDAGGDGYAHKTILPAMKELDIIEMMDDQAISELMKSRQ